MALLIQPKFAHHLQTLAMPLEGKQFGNLQRGYMQWEHSIAAAGGKAKMNYLFNPATVQADFAMSDPSAQASLLFPVAGDTSDLRIPLNQTASWSILFDRTYELSGQYKADGSPKNANPNNNDPSVVGCLADIYQMQQFTGMTFNYTNADGSKDFKSSPGILQLIPSYAYFGTKANLTYFGYITAWDYTITHWTQKMVPMRCVIDISWNFLPNEPTASGTTGGIYPTPTGKLPAPGQPGNPIGLANTPQLSTTRTGIGGR